MSKTAAGARIYNLFPLMAGTIEQWKSHLGRIAEMGFNWVFINPFHETGASGSLYAVKDYYSLNPAFRGRARKADAALIEGVVAAADKLGLGVMMDLVINHTAIDGRLPEEHPNWFVRDHEGRLVCPFAVDPADTRKKTVWRDLAEINYGDGPQRGELIDYFGKVIRHYMDLGIRGYRCDAAYKVPEQVWRPLIEGAHQVRPDTVFLAENLGAMLEQVEALRGAGFDYLLNSSKWWDFEASWLLEQYEKFRFIAPSISFPETHDTSRLAADLAAEGVTDAAALERECKRAYLFAAVFSTGVMIPMGFEYGFRKRLHVVDTRPEDWNEAHAFDLSGYIAEVNAMKMAAPALNQEGPQRAIHLDGGRVTCLQRRVDGSGAWAVTFLNRDRHGVSHVQAVELDGDVRDGREITPGGSGGSFSAGDAVMLEPGAIRVYAGG